MTTTTRFFIYEKATKRIVTYCDKAFGKWCLDNSDPHRARLEIGWRQVIRHEPGFLGTAASTTFVYPHDHSSMGSTETAGWFSRENLPPAGDTLIRAYQSGPSEHAGGEDEVAMSGLCVVSADVFRAQDAIYSHWQPLNSSSDATLPQNGRATPTT